MRTRLRRLLMAASCVLLLAAPARAGIIANGLAPPNPENVVEDDSHLVLDVYDLGCPDGDPGGTPCSSEVHT